MCPLKLANCAIMSCDENYIDKNSKKEFKRLIKYVHRTKSASIFIELMCFNKKKMNNNKEANSGLKNRSQ